MVEAVRDHQSKGRRTPMNAITMPALRPAPFPERHTPVGRAELHFHILPGVDDGPPDMDEAIEMALVACLEGTAVVVSTPHVRGDFVTDVSDLPARLHEVRATLAGEGIDLLLLPGAELGHDMVGRLSQHELESLAQGPPGARWLLLETPYAGISEEFTEAADELRARGFACVLAHPERALGILGDGWAELQDEVTAGSVLQINAGSLEGRHGDDARIAAFFLLERFPCVISSDAHGRRRGPALTPGLRAAITHGVRPDVAHRMVDEVPRALLRDGLAVPVAGAA
jgi:protein-tyrosine phosphatase